MSQDELNNQQSHKMSFIGKIFILFFSLCFIFFFALLAFLGWGYYKLTRTNDLAEYASEKLSRRNKYSINIEHFKNTLPIITAENVIYKKISDVSTLTISVEELVTYPDYLNIKKGTHSFQFNNASMFLQNHKFLMDAKNIQLYGKQKEKDIFIASSTWNVFGGKIYLSGHINVAKRPSPYEIKADLIYVRLQDILEGTKHKGQYTGDVYSKLDLQSEAGKKSPIYGNASLSITNGTYYKPELILRINSALRKIGLHNTLKDLAESVASSSFSLNGDFKLIGNAYETDNTELRTPWSLIRFSGVIGPKSALNGTLRIRYKDYSDFTIKVSGEDRKHMSYKISDGDKARLASIFIREVSKGTGEQIRKEGHRTNRRFNNGLDSLGKGLRKLFKGK